MLHLRNGIWVNGSSSSNPSRPSPRQVINKKLNPSSSLPGSGQGINFVSKSENRSLDPLLKTDKIRICIQRTIGGIGDVMMMTPIARGVKLKYPNSHVTFSVPLDYANGALTEVLFHNPYINEIVDCRNIVKSSYHIFTDLSSSALSTEKPFTTFPNRIDLFAADANVSLFDQPLPIYTVTKEEKIWGLEYIKKRLKGKKYKGILAIQTRSLDRKKTWPIENVKQFMNLARQEGYHCFVFGWQDNPNEWNVAESTLVFDFKIRRAISILSQCDLLVCPDSSLLHIGGALNMNMVGLFGATPPESRINHYPYAVGVVNTKCKCLGCVYNACRYDAECMRGIDPQEVMDVVKDRLINKEEPVSQLKITLNKKVIIRTFEILGLCLGLGLDAILGAI